MESVDDIEQLEDIKKDPRGCINGCLAEAGCSMLGTMLLAAAILLGVGLYEGCCQDKSGPVEEKVVTSYAPTPQSTYLRH